jgi:hypothetical protein
LLRFLGWQHVRMGIQPISPTRPHSLRKHPKAHAQRISHGKKNSMFRNRL